MVGGYNGLKKTIRTGSPDEILKKYSELITRTVDKIIKNEIKGDSRMMFESIKSLKLILERAEILYNELKSENINREVAESKVDDMCDAINEYKSLMDRAVDGKDQRVEAE